MPLTVSPKAKVLRGGAARLSNELKAGRVYRRDDLAQLSTAVERHLRELVDAGKLKKLAQAVSRAQTIKLRAIAA